MFKNRTQLIKTDVVCGMKLKRTKQCKECPWRVDSDLKKIPNYNREWHEGLRKTIAKDFDGNFNFKAMACHESPEDSEYYCIGWLSNQLGKGNNIPLRLKMRECENLSKIELIGEQHSHFDETL